MTVNSGRLLKQSLLSDFSEFVMKCDCETCPCHRGAYSSWDPEAEGVIENVQDDYRSRLEAALSKASEADKLNGYGDGYTLLRKVVEELIS